MGFHFFAMISRMKYINRWSLMRNVRTENICEHSHDVAVLAHALAVITNKRFGGNVDAGRCVLLALYHDMPEILIGDLPAPVKYYNPEIRDAYKHIERVSGEKLLTMLPEDMREEYRPLLTPGGEYPEEQKIVRAADKLSALIKCIEEERQGNSEFEKAKRATEKAVRDLNLPAADFFVKEYLPSYFLTLDEQDH
jgi:5'-deoxynucleotidase